MDRLSASEALYGFCGWITSQEKSITAGSTHDCAVWADKVKDFCDANNLDIPQEGWEKSLVHPKTN